MWEGGGGGGGWGGAPSPSAPPPRLAPEARAPRSSQMRTRTSVCLRVRSRAGRSQVQSSPVLVLDLRSDPRCAATLGPTLGASQPV